jgi:hypothetical protein
VTPAAVDPDPTVTSANVLTRNPDCPTVRRSGISARNPDVASAVPALITRTPDPVRVATGTDGNNFTGISRRTSADHDLCIGHASGYQNTANKSEKYLFHLAISLLLLPDITPSLLCKLR